MYVEATTAGPPRRHVDAERRKGLLLDAVDALHCEYFSLRVTVVAIGPKALAPGRVRRELVAWLTGLDPDTVAANVAAAPPDADSDEEAGYPVLVTVRDGWDIEWTAYPLPAEWRGREGRLIDSESMPEAVAVEDEKPLRGSLQRKASRYGRLDGPYIVAVGEEPFSPGDVQDHRADALYGSSAVVLHGPEAGRPLRLPDGSWRRGAAGGTRGCREYCSWPACAPGTRKTRCPSFGSILLPRSLSRLGCRTGACNASRSPPDRDG